MLAEQTISRETDSEKALLGSVMIDPSMLDAVMLEVSGADFFDVELGKMFDAMMLVSQSGGAVGDPLLLAKELSAMNIPAGIRSLSFLAELLKFVPHAQNAVYYAQQIRTAALLREIQAIGLELAKRTSNAGARPQDLASWMDAKLQGIGCKQVSPVRRIDSIAADMLAEARKPAERGAPVMTGLLTVDNATGGFAAGELIILAARPGVGKTAFATQIALYNANQDRKALLVSLEMSDSELITRVLCGMAGVDSRSVRGKNASPKQLERLEQSAERIGDAPLFVWSPVSATLSKIRAIARQQAAVSPLSMLVVDYLQLMRPESDERRMQRHEQVSAMSSGLKILARELKVPVLCLAQLNREADGNEPKLSHLRESGSIEQDADAVLFLHPGAAAVGDSPARASLIVAKHRHGDTGKLELAWYPQTTTFGEPPNQEWDPYA